MNEKITTYPIYSGNGCYWQHSIWINLRCSRQHRHWSCHVQNQNDICKHETTKSCYRELVMSNHIYINIHELSYEQSLHSIPVLESFLLDWAQCECQTTSLPKWHKIVFTLSFVVVTTSYTLFILLFSSKQHYSRDVVGKPTIYRKIK